MDTFPFVQGFALCGGLIMTIGAQNAFLLTQAIRREHHLAIATLCCFGDIVLIGLGVAGMGSLIAASPLLGNSTALGGAIFLFWYGLVCLRRALRGEYHVEGELKARSLRSALTTTLAVTFLNPHAWLETVVIVGGVAGQLPDADRLVFGLGAVSASITWFYLLALGGRVLAPLFARPICWRMLDVFVWLVVWTIGSMLAREFILDVLV